MVLRIGGLASGMDIDTLVEQLMTAERVPLDKINQKKTYTEWQRDDYREMNSLLLDLDNTIFNGISRQASFIKKTVAVSNSDALSVKNVNSTIDFSGSLKINQLATAATMQSNTAIDISDSSKTLSELGISLGSNTITIQAIKKDGTLQTETEAFSYTIDPSKDTLNSIIATINKSSGVTAFYDSVSKKIAISANNTGDVAETPEIVLSGDFFTNTLKLDSTNIEAANKKDINGIPLGALGQNAEITFNGLTTSRPSNTFTINGVEFTAKKVTTEAITFSSTPDVDGIVDTIKQFVNKYNEAIEKMRGKTTEKKYRDYTPLTDAQKKEMSEDEVEKWEKLAKSGTLYNDSILNSALTKMRTNISSPVTGTSTYSQLSQIGISTTSNYLEGGKLTIDEDKLRAAISADPNAVYELFQKDGATSSEQGIARRLRSSLKTAMADITAKAGKSTSINNTFSLGRALNDYASQITRFEDKLKMVESRYWARFTAMETAINKANSQSTYLTNMFSS
ncbi:flagellar hook-associated protein 2 [Cytobacillus oceanisediminis]|uniref:flagellar hook-associated protein 2 n=1 Tax=Cytobacillus oceanisediminis TaxID=665099 RepID=UPI001CC9BE06|nr:flagellar hook-associated protein 2 [Cytobacillus oceanisediminis]MBZ9535248.1 flagellar hook-associated protein 2 [Cytobacillus oceanisediminis]